jgi:subtilase family serine protease
MVKDVNTCQSDAINCAASNCAARISNTTGNVGEEMNETPTSGPGNKPLNEIYTSALKQLTVQVAPNAFTDQVEFKVFALQSGNGTLDIINLYGQKIASVFSGYMNEGQNQYKVNFSKLEQTNFIYRLTVDGKQITGKLLQIPE